MQFHRFTRSLVADKDQEWAHLFLQPENGTEAILEKCVGGYLMDSPHHSSFIPQNIVNDPPATPDLLCFTMISHDLSTRAL